jgi:hypothetical protein
MPRPAPSGDLAKARSIEADEAWPTLIEVVAYWSKSGNRKGRRRSIEIPSDQFFGFGRYGAPLSGEALIAMVERLRKDGPKPPSDS